MYQGGVEISCDQANLCSWLVNFHARTSTNLNLHPSKLSTSAHSEVFHPCTALQPAVFILHTHLSGCRATRTRARPKLYGVETMKCGQPGADTVFLISSPSTFVTLVSLIWKTLGTFKRVQICSSVGCPASSSPTLRVMIRIVRGLEHWIHCLDFLQAALEVEELSSFGLLPVVRNSTPQLGEASPLDSTEV